MSAEVSKVQNVSVSQSLFVVGIICYWTTTTRTSFALLNICLLTACSCMTSERPTKASHKPPEEPYNSE